MSTENYSPEETNLVLQLYADGVSPQHIATTTQRSERSIIAKLSREGVYITNSKPTKPKAKTKMQLLDEIAAQLKTIPLDSLEKGTKEEILALHTAVVPQK